ncbi:hypothetical protein MMC30_009404 [Trapelia coarctata]|nr:hypothetical protein [Trapelia coarctata]
MQTATTKGELEQQITDFERFNTIKDQAFSAINTATEDRVKYQEKRATGMRKIGQIAQNFLNHFSDFVRAYSGIVELLKGAGQVYGAVAYETLSVFLIVVVNKNGNDTKISNLLEELRESFPQLDNWVDIYPFPSIKTSVAKVYKQVIDFARDASLYFTRFSVRLRRSIGRPPSMGIDITVRMMHRALAAVNKEATIELHRRNQNIQRTAEESNTYIKDLKREQNRLLEINEQIKAEFQAYKQGVEEKERLEDVQRLEFFKATTKVPFSYSETDRKACKESLDRAFKPTSSSPRSPSSRYIHMSPELLNTSEEYRKWQSITQSCLLVLSGRTVIEGRNSHGLTHSWLSPATIHVAEEAAIDGKKVAYYCFHPDNRADIDPKKDFLSTLICQILEWKPSILRRKNQHFLSVVSSKEWGDRETHKTALAVRFSLLREVLVEMKDLGSITMVLDRIELCNWKLLVLMHALVGFVASLTVDDCCVVKIMVVLDTAKEYWDAESLEEKDADRVMLYQRWDQEQMSPLEMQKRFYSY